MTIDKKPDAIIRALITAAGPENELAQALHHSGNRNPCDQIVGKLLTSRVRRAHEAARRAASVALRTYWNDITTEKNDTHKVIQALLCQISVVLGGAKLPTDDTGVDFSNEVRFARIHDLAWCADAFTDVVLDACTLAEASPTASADSDGTRIRSLQSAEASVH